ncbi:MAG: HAMP domain-containing histidine kinase [Planctomycetes bacterium]|nr:HAMP domain-containing histidine kinase [Planctomycetota bacterium]
MASRVASRLLPWWLGAGALGLTAAGWVAVANDLSVAELRAREKAREQVRIAAQRVAADLDRESAALALAPSLDEWQSVHPHQVAFEVNGTGAIVWPERPAPAEPSTDERRLVEALLDEAAAQARSDGAAARRTLERAATASNHRRLTASVALARAAFELRQGEPQGALAFLIDPLTAHGLRTLRAEVSIPAIANILAARCEAALGRREEAQRALAAAGLAAVDLSRSALVALREAAEDAARTMPGLTVPEFDASSQKKAERFEALALLESRASELRADRTRLGLGEWLVLLAPMSADRRRGVVLLDSWWESLPWRSGGSGAGGDAAAPWTVARSAGEVVDATSIEGADGMLWVGYPLGFIASDPTAETRAWAQAALVAMLGASVLGAAWLLASASRRELEAARAKSEFLAGVTHELKTPLASIRLYAEMLDDGMLTSEGDRASAVKTIGREAQRLTRLIDRVLALARTERARRPTRTEHGAIAAAELVRAAEATFLPVATREGVAFSAEVAQGDTMLAVDGAAVGQALLDLLENALKYGDGKPVLLRGERTSGGYRLSVLDRGRGLPPGDPAKLFHWFSRGDDTTTREQPGLGIGLALAERLVEGSGGTLAAQPREGGGSVFVMELPLAQAGAGAEAIKDSEEQP